MTNAVVAIVVGVGAALVVTGVLLRGRERARYLQEVLDLPWGEKDVPTEAIQARAAALAHAAGLASQMIDRLDAKGYLRKSLEAARVPLRPGEYVLAVSSTGIACALALWLFSAQWYFALLALALAPVGGALFLRARVNRRLKKFEAQLPDALSLIAGSLSAGHTFLRAIQMLCEEAESPLKDEFARVVSETQLGDPLVDSLERMATRLGAPDLDMVVQAIRVQQTVGGKLADLLHTLADFIRARETLRREVDVLTAEGRMSAWVLGGLPFVLLVMISVGNPHYMKPMYHGWGYAWLAGTAVSVVAGMSVILRMVHKIEV